VKLFDSDILQMMNGVPTNSAPTRTQSLACGVRSHIISLPITEVASQHTCAKSLRFWGWGIMYLPLTARSPTTIPLQRLWPMSISPQHLSLQKVITIYIHSNITALGMEWALGACAGVECLTAPARCGSPPGRRLISVMLQLSSA
jgi:hypothetical protein